MLVEKLMRKDVKTCSASDMLDRAAQIMWENDVGVVPVTDDKGRVISVITDRDICMAAYTQGRPLHAIPVATASSRRLFAIHPNDTLEVAEQKMREHQVRRLPVTNGDGRIAGILSLNDLARHTSRRNGGVTADQVASTLQAIGASAPAPHAASPSRPS
jgi:CBS domain-containing protein